MIVQASYRNRAIKLEEVEVTNLKQTGGCPGNVQLGKLRAQRDVCRNYFGQVSWMRPTEYFGLLLDPAVSGVFAASRVAARYGETKRPLA